MLIIILISIAALAMLTMMVSKTSEQQSDVISRQTRDDQLSRLLAQASTLGGAINQMLVNGEDPAALYKVPPDGINQVLPGAAGFETSPHNLKLYHPMGGGVSYLSSSSPDSTAIATAYSINQTSIITGVGETDVTVGDIVFTAKISAVEYCQRLNEIVTGSSAVPAMADATFDALFTAGTVVTVDGTNCANCIKKARICVANVSGNAWGFYAALLPG